MKYCIVILSMLLAGCGATDSLSLLEKVSDGAGKVEDVTIGNAAKALPKYCLAPGVVRKAFRSRLNGRSEAAGNQIAIWCVGDAPLTLGP